MHARFREGVAAWIAQMPAKPVEYQLLDLEPELPDDAAPYAAAFAYLAWGLSNNWEAELLRAELDAAVGRAATDRLLPPSAPGGGGVGSNNWVVAARRSAGGAPLLANDPHLLATQPGIWLELHLRAPGYEARGVATPFSPGIFLGTTPHHAWGVTNVTGDVQDLYEEQLNDDGTAARRGDGWEPLTIHEERITVRGENEPRVVMVRETRHGPILTHGVAGTLQTRYRPIVGTHALRWTGADATIRPSLALAVANADGPAAFATAVLQVACPGQNFVYADVDGHIAYQCTGHHPIRENGDGTRPVPGWNDEHEWGGWIPDDELPAEVDPERGWIATANNDIQPPDFDHLISRDFHSSSRYDRIAELLDATREHDVASFATIQADSISVAALRLLPHLTKIEPGDQRQRDALDALAARWDGSLGADSRDGAVFETWITALMGRLVGSRVPEDTFAAYQGFRETFVTRVLPDLLTNGTDRLDPEALRDALDEALDATDGKTWGDLHILSLAHPLARIPGLETLFTAATIPLGGDGQTVAQAGFDVVDGAYRPAVIQSVRAVYDLGDLERSVSVLPTGISGNPASPHYADQHAMWVMGGAKPAGFHTETVASLSLRPA
jgi:penicillin amidase